MEFVSWKSCYCVGDPTIDYQHRRLVALLNLLHDKIHSKASAILVDKALIELINYAEEHFRDEERLMESINYPYLAEHRAEHERLVIEVFAFKERYDKGLVSGRDLLEFLREWLIQHILGSDLMIKHYLPRVKC